MKDRREGKGRGFGEDSPMKTLGGLLNRPKSFSSWKTGERVKGKTERYSTNLWLLLLSLAGCITVYTICYDVIATANSRNSIAFFRRRMTLQRRPIIGGRTALCWCTAWRTPIPCAPPAKPGTNWRRCGTRRTCRQCSWPTRPTCAERVRAWPEVRNSQCCTRLRTSAWALASQFLASAPLSRSCAAVSGGDALAINCSGGARAVDSRLKPRYTRWWPSFINPHLNTTLFMQHALNYMIVMSWPLWSLWRCCSTHTLVVFLFSNTYGITCEPRNFSGVRETKRCAPRWKAVLGT